MNLRKIRIDGIPVILWGEPSDKIIIAAHGSHSSKIDDCIWVLAEEATAKGYQVLSFDLPQHGERVYETDFIMPDECVRELKAMYSFAVNQGEKVSIFGCSMGAYFELLAFADMDIEYAWFLSPVTDMERIIHNLMEYCHITEKEFQERVKIENDIEPLYFPYYTYVKSHPINIWNHKTFILRGENDTLCEYDYVKTFADNFGCELTEQQGGEHWFHTDFELDFSETGLEKDFIKSQICGGNTMLENIPSQSAMTELLGQPLYKVWQELCSVIDEKYDMERLWNTGGKNWTYEYKYRRGGKTLCSLYAKNNCVGFMIIFGKDERAKFEEIRETLSDSVCRQYDEATTYRDGKWVMFEPTDTSEFDDYMKLLAIKRKPNRK